MATGKELDELIQYHNKENQDDNVEKQNCTNRKLNETYANDDLR